VIAVDFGLSGAAVARVLERLAGTKGLPNAIVVDNGPEFAGRTLDLWAHQRGLQLDFITPGKPVQNAFVECFSEHWFLTLEDGRQAMDMWRRENQERPHSSLGHRTPRGRRTLHPTGVS